jgi:hypothetical protein
MGVDRAIHFETDHELDGIAQADVLARAIREEAADLVFVGGKPLKLIEEVGRDEQLHLLAIPPERIKAAYVPSELTADAYPSLIEPGNPVQTVAVSAVLAAYNWAPEHPRRGKLTRFIERFYVNFDRLLEPPFHPKWQEVDLKGEVPGWQRIAPAGNVALAGE